MEEEKPSVPTEEKEEEHKEHKTENEVEPKVKKDITKNITKKIRKNPWIISTLVLGILTLILVAGNFPGGMTVNIVSEDIAGRNLVEFLNQNSASEVTLDSVSDEGNLYKVNIEYQGQIIPLYMTKDGKYYVQGVTPITGAYSQNQEESAEPILECVEPYGITEDTIIFYYSNSCGWCTKMKPGVEILEKEGYKFYWVEGSDVEASELIDNCVRSYMTSGGVPQFICSKTNEIHVGAFADENGDLDQLALKEWVDNCISD